MGREILRCKKVDRYVLPPQEVFSGVSTKTAADIREAIRAANARCIPAATVMLRRALERECKLHGAAGKTLHQQIVSLEAQGIISKIQASTAHAIRAFGNYGAHPENDLLDDVDEEQLDAAIKLTIALIRGWKKDKLRRFEEALREMKLKATLDAQSSPKPPS
jgi:hypothetical protein